MENETLKKIFKLMLLHLGYSFSIEQLKFYILVKFKGLSY